MRRFFSCFLVLACVGCSAAPSLELQPVKGRVLRDGKPVAGGAVVLKRTDDQSIISINAEVDAEGWFQPATIQDEDRRPGMPAGSYLATYCPPTSTDQSVLPRTLNQVIRVDANTRELIIDIGTAD